MVQPQEGLQPRIRTQTISFISTRKGALSLVVCKELIMRILIICLITLLSALAFGSVYAVQCKNNFPPTNPDSVYDVHADGTVTDTRTGLMWKRCSEGQSWNGSTCTGSASIFNWADALNHVLTLTDAGHEDWRLPNINELESLVEDCTYGPAINTDIFPNTPSSHFWSASPNAFDSSGAWSVYFGDGVSYDSDRSSYLRVRAVRGGQSFDPLDGACGSADGAASATEPAANLCSAGSAMSVTGSDDQWQWGCKGENGGADTAADACTADYASQTLSISADPTSIEVGETSDITASSDAGLAVDLAASGACSLSGTTATGTAEGTCTITASQPGTGDTGTERYLPAADETTDIIVSLAAVDGACGSAHNTGTAPLLPDEPGADLCSAGNSSAVTGGNTRWDWSCYGLGGGNDATCQAPRGYEVTVSAGANGGVSPGGAQVVEYGASLSFTVSPAAGYEIDTVTGCGGSLSGNVYTIDSVESACTITASFVVLTPADTPVTVPVNARWALVFLSLLLGGLGLATMRRRT